MFGTPGLLALSYMKRDIRAEIALHSVILVQNLICCKWDFIMITSLKVGLYLNSYAISERTYPFTPSYLSPVSADFYLPSQGH